MIYLPLFITFYKYDLSPFIYFILQIWFISLYLLHFTILFISPYVLHFTLIIPIPLSQYIFYLPLFI